MDVEYNVWASRTFFGVWQGGPGPQLSPHTHARTCVHGITADALLVTYEMSRFCGARSCPV